MFSSLCRHCESDIKVSNRPGILCRIDSFGKRASSSWSYYCDNCKSRVQKWYYDVKPHLCTFIIHCMTRALVQSFWPSPNPGNLHPAHLNVVRRIYLFDSIGPFHSMFLVLFISIPQTGFIAGAELSPIDNRSSLFLRSSSESQEAGRASGWFRCVIYCIFVSNLISPSSLIIPLSNQAIKYDES